MPLCGGVGDFKPADATLTAEYVTASVMEELKKQLNNASTVTLTEYATQIVAGVNCHVKGNADGKEFKAVIFKPLPHTGQPNSVSKVEF